MIALTIRQQEVLAFFRAYTTRRGMPPTVREVGDKFGFTARAAFDHIRALMRKGKLVRTEGHRPSRAYSLVDPGVCSQCRRPLAASPAAGVNP